LRRSLARWQRSPARSPRSAALEAAGVIFVDENGEWPGVRLRKSAALDAKAEPGHIPSDSSGKDRE
jgi:hypothetical protein